MAVVYEQGESFADLQKKNTIQDESEDVGFFESALAVLLLVYGIYQKVLYR